MGASATSSTTTDLLVGGMSCAACVARVEKRLGRIAGVTATVNLATGRARVDHPRDVTVEELIAAVEAGGYTAAVPEPERPEAPAENTAVGPTPGTRLLITVLLAVPVMVLSMVPDWQFRNWQWLCLTLAAPVATWGAWPFHQRALRGLRHGSATMDTLVSLGVVASLSWSVYALFLGGAGVPGMRMPFSLLPAAPGDGVAHIYLEAAVGVPLLVLTGRWLEGRARRGTGSALRALAELGVKEVTVREDGAERTVPIGELNVGGLFVVRPGERVATDGTVTEGSSALDVSLVTGESMPMEATPGTAVVGGAVNVGGLLVVRAEAVGADTQLARITRLVEEAQTGKARVQRVADAVAGVFVPTVVSVAVTVLGFWLGAGAAPQIAVTAAVAVLVVACPCALGLATPTALLAATGRGAQLGILVSGPAALERLRRIDTVLLDKTGTLTTGRMSVTTVTAVGDSVEAARFAGAVEAGSEHPVGRAIVAHARRVCPDALPRVEDFLAVAGHGVSGRADGRAVAVTAPGNVDDLPAELRAAVRTAEEAGHTAVLLTVDDSPEAVFAVSDTVRAGSYRAVDHLRRLGVRPVMVTGDRDVTARAVAAQLGITEVHSQARPEDKAQLVRAMRDEGRKVAVVGDGVNDAPALAGADLGIAMGSGTDAAIGAADVTLVREDIQVIAHAVLLARRTLGTIRLNLVWAFGYNLITLPLAAIGRLDPMPAAAAMSASSLLVVGNSLRLRGWRPVPRSRAIPAESWEQR